MIRRRGVPEVESSEDEEDVFSNLAQKDSKSRSRAPSSADVAVTTSENPSPPGKESLIRAEVIPVVAPITSSMKRHHGAMSNSRKAQMDALIQELEAEKVNARRQDFVPDKKGSYVEPGEEHLTTNLFVGNIDPILSEEAILNVFLSFGDLHSYKIMWPRTEEERARNRVTAFICYRYRQDAEEAMAQCNEADPFRVRRRLMVRWGKTVAGSGEDLLVPTKRPKMEAVGKASSERTVDTKVIIPDDRSRVKPSSQPKPRRNRYLDGNVELHPEEMQEFHELTRQCLCASREAICRAMAFCFDHTSSYIQIGALLKDLIMDGECSVETRVARLYLLSDILFNSQQPGVKNAFRYRDAIQAMAHDVFYSLGQHSDTSISRMKRNKIQTAVRSVLAAWTNWSVFDPSFLDELEARFDGREIIKPVAIKEEEDFMESDKQEHTEEKESITLAAQGNWAEVDEDEKGPGTPIQSTENDRTTEEEKLHRADRESKQQMQNMDDIDGEPLEDGDLDEDGLRRLRAIHQVTDDDEPSVAVHKSKAEQEKICAASNEPSGSVNESVVQKGNVESDIDGEPLGDDPLNTAVL